MAKELREILAPRDKFTILGEGKAKSGGNILNLLVPWGQADEKTLNGRIYSKPLLHREVDRIQKAVESGAFIGTGDHPASGVADVKTASHIVKKIWLDEGGRGWAQIKVLDTERGKNIQAIIKAGGQLGISTRGFGNTAKNGQVLDDYKMQGIDIVMNPSVSTATFSKANIFESVGFEEEKKVEEVKQTKVKIDEKNIEAAIRIGFDAEVSEYGLKEDWEHYKARKLTLVTAGWLLEEYPDKFPSVEQALEYLGAPELAEKYYEEIENDDERVLLYTASEVASEAYAAGINPKEMADKLNANLKLTAALNAEKITAKERQIMNEMRDAGAMDEPIELLEKVRKVLQAQKIFEPNLSEAQQLIEMEKRAKKIEEVKRERIIQQVNRDISAGGGAEPEVAKAMVNRALKEEGLSLEEEV